MLVIGGSLPGLPGQYISVDSKYYVHGNENNIGKAGHKNLSNINQNFSD